MSFMDTRRLVILATSICVAILAAIPLIVRWELANRIVTTVAAVAGVAAVGVAIWAVAAPRQKDASVHVGRTGDAVAEGTGSANTGITGPVVAPGVSIEVDLTGRAEARGGADANTGMRSHPGDGR